MHDFPLITTIAAAFTLAWILGIITHRLGLSPIVGYLIAGVMVGPHTPGFAGDVDLAKQLAEIGVILLMFGVGLHFQFKDLIAVRHIAIPGAVGQTLVATLAGAAIFSAFGWPMSAALIIGVAIAVASTVVLMRVLTDAGQLDTAPGHAAVGWLLVEDVITVIVLVLIPAQAAGESEPQAWFVSMGVALVKLGALIALAVIAGSPLVSKVLEMVARLHSRELFTLTVLVLSIAVATASAVFFGASVALGAFLGGMMVAQSPTSQQAAADALPMRDAFAVLFFVSVGMLFDPRFMLQQPLMVAAALGIVLLIKPLAALVLVAVLGYPVRTGLFIAIGLAQIGEFSFIVAEIARKHDLLPAEGYHVLVACALVSITLNPLLFRFINRIELLIHRTPILGSLIHWRVNRRTGESNLRATEQIASSSKPLALIVGFGPSGQHVDRLLREAGLETVIVEMNMDTVTALSSQGYPVIFGDASQGAILEVAGIVRASYLVLTMSDSSRHGGLISMAQDLNPSVRIIARARYVRERDQFPLAPDCLAIDEIEAAVALTHMVLLETGAAPDRIKQEAERVRRDLAAKP